MRPAREMDIETAPAVSAFLQAARDQAVGIRRKPRISMEKQQYIAGGHGGAGIHLRGAAARRRYRLVGEGARKTQIAVGAAAIDPDYFGTAPAQRSERFERRADFGGLIEHGDDDRETHSAASLSA